MEYKRPTKIIDLPSGKKVEIVEYFSQDEVDKMKEIMLAGQKIKGSTIIETQKGEVDENSFLKDFEFSLEAMNNANRFAKEKAVKKLFDKDGKEYEATPESINDFLDEEDGNALKEALNKMTNKKKSLEKK